MNIQTSVYFDSINKIPDMLLTAHQLGMAGIALTDHECLCGHLKWLKAEEQLKKDGKLPETFKAALGNEIYLVEDRNNIEKYWHYILIAKNNEGHRALRELSSTAWYYGFNSRGMMRVPTQMDELEAIVKKYPNSLIATSACFRKGTLVLTSNGEKPIEEITDNDFILNRYGEWEKVNFPTHRNYNGVGKKIYFVENPEPTICTENHEFLITTDNKIRQYKLTGHNPIQWIEAKNLNTRTGGTKHICLFPIKNIEYTHEDIIYEKEWRYSLRKNNYKTKIKIKSEIKITPELMRLFGLWLGDGSISVNPDKNLYRVDISFSDEEFDYYWNSFVKSASEEIGITWSIFRREAAHKVSIATSSVEFVELFYYLFGNSKADTKHIPSRLKHISKELDYNLFMGYAFADGHFREREKDGYKYGEMCVVSISPKLIKDFQDLLKTLKIRSSITIKDEYTSKDNVHHKKSYYLSSSNIAWTKINKKSFIGNNDIIISMNKAIQHDKKKFIEINGTTYKKVYIKSISSIALNEEVHCLNVNSHSFCCNGCIVHNCIGGYIGNRVIALSRAEQRENNENEINTLKKEINDFILWNKKLFGDDFYCEIAAGQSSDQRRFNERIKSIARAYDLKIVVGSDAHYLTAKERPLHKAYLNSKEGEREIDQFYYDAHMMDNDEAYENLKDFYSEEEFIQMCNNSMEIYNKIEGYDLCHKPIIPEAKVKEYPVLEEYRDIDLKQYPVIKKILKGNIQERYWINQCLTNLYEKKLVNQEYLKRLEIEADVIYTIGEKIDDCLFKYFNTFHSLIDIFWDCGSIIPPGRGSSVCYLSNYLMGITQLDPVKLDLPYFRFLNKERVELPDIDVDVSPSKRKAIFEVIRQQRGEINLLQVATFGTEGTRQAIASAGRGYRSEEYPDGLDVETTQYLSGLIPQERGFLPSIHEVIYGNEEKGKRPIQAFIDEVNKYPGLLEIIEGIEGLVCRRGEHASGVMIYNNSPFETNAIMRSPNGDLTTQFELHDSDQMGK